MLNKLFAKKLSHAQQHTLIDKLKELVLSRVTPRTLILFGSAARLQMTEASDIDLLFVFDSEKEVKEARKKTTDLSIVLDWPVDKLFYTTAEFKRLSELGGVSMVASDEGRMLFSKVEKE